MPTRKDLSVLIDQVLGGSELHPQFWSNKPLLEGPPAQIEDRTNDPNMQLALELAKAKYPEATNRVQKFILRPNGQGFNDAGGIYGRNIIIAPTDAYPPGENQEGKYRHEQRMPNLTDALDVLRHELAHVMGAQEHASFDKEDPAWNAPIGAYDVSDASHGLHQDIELPKDVRLKSKK